MSYNSKILSKLNLTGIANKESANSVVDIMCEPAYLRQSSALINDALQQGFDILQLADGDIVMTGVKTVVYQYTWDAAQGKLVRTRAETSGDATKEKTSLLDMENEADAVF